MKVLQRGHKYELSHRGGSKTTVIQYVNREPGQETEGVLQQELLRMMIDRNRYCNNCLPHRDNDQIQYHLRMALALHEGRALQRKVEKGELAIEYINTDHDGHLSLYPRNLQNEGEIFHTENLDPVPPREGSCNYKSGE